MLKYGLLDKNSQFNPIYSTYNLDTCLHEYLTAVCSELDVLVKNNVKRRLDLLHLSHLYVVEYQEEISKRYPVINRRIEYNLGKQDFNVNITDSDILTPLLNKIKNNLKYIVPSPKNHAAINDAEKLFDLKKNSKLTSNQISDTNMESKKEIKLIDYEKLNFEKKQKDKFEENTRIFLSDKKIYYSLKKDIDDKILQYDDIPELFKKKYPIFQCMDEMLQLEDHDALETYLSLYDELYPKEEEIEKEKEEFIPHNINYL